jgi:hypothetical protein
MVLPSSDEGCRTTAAAAKLRTAHSVAHRTVAGIGPAGTARARAAGKREACRPRGKKLVVPRA